MDNVERNDKNSDNHTDNIEILFKEFGEYVQKKREQKGLLIEDIAAHLKISLYILHAIENGNFDIIPHFIYIKGFMRSYALYLGIKEYEVQAFFQKIECREIDTKENKNEKNKKQLYIYMSSILLFCFVLVFFCYFEGFGFYHFLKSQEWSSFEKFITKGTNFEKVSIDADRNNKEHSNVESKTELVSIGSPTFLLIKKKEFTKLEKILGSKSFSDLEIGFTSQEVSNINLEKYKDKKIGFEPLDSKEFNAQKSIACIDPQEVEHNKDEVKCIYINNNGQKNIVILKGIEECWVHSTADSKETRQFSIQPGQLFALSFQDTLVLKLGNAGGVEIKHNGEKIPSIGRKGQVKTVSFPFNSQH